MNSAKILNVLNWLVLMGEGKQRARQIDEQF